MDFVEINIEQNVKNLKHFNICDFDCDLRYVSLESNSLFLKAAALYDFSKDYFVVSDRTICLLYDWQGNFISQIGRIGKGSGEYLRVSHVQFGPDQNIYTNDGRSISVYDFGGRFKRIFKPESNPDKVVFGGNVVTFATINDSLFIGQIRNDRGDEKYKAIVFNQEGKAIKLVPNTRIQKFKSLKSRSANGDANIYKQGNFTFIKERLCDTVFRLTEN
jgi:hypothetical protein